MGVVSAYAENGSLSRYLKRTSPTNAERYKILREVAAAIAYLHCPQPEIVVEGRKIHVVHGDIHPGNVLIMGDGRAVLSDFGLCKLTPEDVRVSLSLRLGDIHGVAAYLAPEVYRLEEFEESTAEELRNLGREEPDYAGRRTEKADVFAFGMLVFTTFGGAGHMGQPGRENVSRAIISGRRPHRINELHDDIWRLICDCWGPRPSFRPSMDEVLIRLQAGRMNVAYD